MHLTLVDPDPAVCAAFSLHFGVLPHIAVMNGRFEDLSFYDCLIVPGTSFGFLEGGIEGEVARHFGEALRQRVRERVRDEFLGEQPVGTAILVETCHPEHPYIAHAPTMRVPMSVAETDNAYVALWAALLAVRRHNQNVERGAGTRAINRLASPVFCTAAGRMSPEESARQMALAYQSFLYPPFAPDWQTAFARQEAIGR
jgi:O-acetyl-ADP-ribose deacetylase (regulator of RNase III)